MVARGLSTDELIISSGVQLLIFAVVYAVWGPYVAEHTSWLLSDYIVTDDNNLILIPGLCEPSTCSTF
jgi:hypothetical protein